MDKNTEAFLSLVRAGLWESEVQLLPFGVIDFDTILAMAEEQGVVGLVAAGIGIKINCDASFNVHTGRSVVAAVARDSTGKILDVVTETRKAGSALVAEAEAIKVGLWLAKRSRWLSILVESDNQPLIQQLLAQEKHQRWDISSICYDIQQLQLEFVHCSFQWISRRANRVADFVAKHCMNVVDWCSWFCNCLEPLNSWILEDLT